MIETSWYRSNLTQLGDQRQGFQVFFQDLVSSFDEARSYWTDTASRDIFTRYLNPHRDEMQRLLAHLQDQLVLHHDVLGCLEAVQQPVRELRHLTAASYELRIECTRHVQKSLHFTETAENDRQIAQRAIEDCNLAMSKVA